MNKKLKLLTVGTALITALTASNMSVLAASENTAVMADTTASKAAYLIENINQPWGLASTSNDSIVVVSSGNNQISSWRNGTLSPITTQTNDGYLDAATSTSTFYQPTYTVVNSKGIIYVSDSENHVVRKIVNDKVYTAAGNGVAGFKDGKFGEAQFNSPAGLAVDADDNIYVADSVNNVIRKITPDGFASTIAGIASETGDYKDGSAAEALFNEPMGIVFDEKGGLYIADSGNHLIRYLYKGVVTTVAGKPTVKDAQTGYMTGGYANGSSGEARFNRPRGLAYTDGVLFVADSLNNRIRALQASGKVITVAGQSTPGNKVGTLEEAQFSQPSSLLYKTGKLYVSDTLNNSVKVLDLDPQSLKAIVTKEDLLAGTELAAPSKETQVWLDGKPLKFSTTQKPYKSGDKTYLPVRDVFLAWGASVKWQAATKEVHLAKGDWKLVLKANAKRTVVLVNGSIYVDASYLEDAASFIIAQDEEYNAIVIQSGS